MDSSGPAKVTRVYSDHTNGSFGVGEKISIFIEFTSAVQVVGDPPSLVLRTGCHDSSCHTREVQRINCRGTAGKFSIAFGDQAVMNIPWNASAHQFAAFVTRMTAIDKVLVKYSIDEDRACTYFGNNITVTFETMNIYGSDGDLPTMTADPLNTNGDGTLLEHIVFTPTLTSTAWEIHKGRRVPDRSAIYVGKVDPKTLKFEYIVQQGDNATFLEYVSSDALKRSIANSRRTKLLNGGSYVPADSTLPPPGFGGDWERGIGSSLSANSALTVDVSAPKVTSVTSLHVDGTFGIGEEILIHVYFSRSVVVTGDPTIVLETGLVDRIVPFNQVLPTNDMVIEFRYVVQSKDTTPDLAYTGTSALQLNTGTIKRKSTTPTTDAILTLPVNGGSGSLSVNKNIVIDTSDPKVLSVTTTTADGVYTAGDVIQVVVTFDVPVAVTGTPQLLLNTGSVDLFPGSFIQQAPAADPKTVVFPPVEHGLSTAMSAGLQFKIGQQILTVSLVNGDNVRMVETYTGSIVNPRISGGPNIPIMSPGYRPAIYASGSGSTQLTFVYTVQVGDTSLDLAYLSRTALITSGGSIRRLSTTPFTSADLTLPTPGATGSLSASSNLVVNTDRPFVLAVNPLTRDGVYRSGEDILIQIVFNIPVVIQGGAELLLALNAPDSERFAAYTSGSGTRSLTFRYTCRPNDPTVPVFDYAGVASLQPAYGEVFGWIRRKSMAPMIPAILALPVTGISSKGISIDQSCIYVTAVSTPAEGGTKGVGEIIDIKVEFSASVDVTTATGIPTIMLTTGGVAIFLSGSGSSVLTFRYVVSISDSSARLNYPDRFALQLNGGAIQSSAGGARAMTLLVPPEASGLAVGNAIFTDISSPVVQSVLARGPANVVAVGDQLEIAVRFNSAIYVQSVLAGAGSPVIYLDAGSGSAVAAPFVASDSNTAYFTYTIGVGQSTSHLQYATRTSLKCIGGRGLNRDSGQDAAFTRARIFQGRLYLMWSEKSASNNKWQVRIKSTDLSQYAPAWRSEDGGAVTSAINYNPGADAISAMMVALSSKLYVVWQESGQIRVALSSPTTPYRTLIDRKPPTSSGINMNAARNAASPHAAIQASKLYIVWHEPATSTGPTQVRVAVYNGNDNSPSWSFVDGNLPAIGLNKVGTNSAQNGRLASCGLPASAGTTYLFAAWEELDATTNVMQIRVAVKTGPDNLPAWRFIDGNGRLGLNANTAMSASSLSMVCAKGTNLVVAWHEQTISGTTQIRTKTFIGTLTTADWVLLDNGRSLNFDPSQIATNVQLNARSASSAVFATWEEVDTGTAKTQLRMAYLPTTAGGAPWKYFDGGQRFSRINNDFAASAFEPKVVVTSTEDRVIVVWHESFSNGNPQLRASLRSTAIEEWQSMSSECILRQSSQPVIAANLLLPAKNTPGALDFSSTVVVDTISPSILNVALVGESIATTASPKQQQTIDVYNLESLIQGQYQLQYGESASTVCINWDAAASGGTGSLEQAIETVPGLSLDVSVSVDTRAFLDGKRYTVTFNFPTAGIQNLRLVTPPSPSCTSFLCQPNAQLRCDANRLIHFDEGSTTMLYHGVTDIAVQFSSPIVVVSGTPTLTLNVGANRAAEYTTRSAVQEFDVGVDFPSQVLKGAFRIAYGDFSSGAAVISGLSTECIDISQIKEDAEQQLRAALESIPALKTIGVISVNRRTYGNGYRYRVVFRNSADLLDLVSADATSCTLASGRTQTIDIKADSQILGGEFKFRLGEVESGCVAWNVRAQGPTQSMQYAISEIYGDRVLPLTVERVAGMFGHGYRFYVNFLMLNDALKPLSAYYHASCTAFTCNDGNGGSTSCSGLSIAANADFQVVNAVSDTLSFRYRVQPGDDVTALQYSSSTALIGNIARASSALSVSALLTLPIPKPLKFSESGIGLLVVSSSFAPSVLGVSPVTLDDTYTVGDVVLLLVTFSRAVVAKGQPLLELNSGGTAVFVSGNESDKLTFHYRIRSGDMTANLNYASIYSLRCPSESNSQILCFSCSSPDIDADLKLPPVNDPASLASTSRLVVDTTPPSIVSVYSSRPDTLPGDVGYGVGDVIDLLVEFSSDVEVDGKASLLLNSGGLASFTYGSYRQVIDVGVSALRPITSGQFAVIYDDTVSGCIDYNDGNSAALTSLRSQLLRYEQIVTIGLVSITASRVKNGYRFVVQFDPTNLVIVPQPIGLAEPDVCSPLLPISPEQVAIRSSDKILTFQYIVQANQNALQLDYTSISVVLDGIDSHIFRRSRVPEIEAVIALPAAGSLMRLGDKSNIAVDGTPVTVVGIALDTAPGTYGVAFPPQSSPATVFPGEIQFRLIFSRAVVVIGMPTLELATGYLQTNGNFLPNRVASFVEQPQPNEATFLYHIEEGDFSANLAFASLNAFEAATVYCISSSSQVAPSKTLPRLVISSGQAVRIDSHSVPTTVRLSSPHPDGVLGTGELIRIEVTFSKAVTLMSGLNMNQDWHARYPTAVEYNDIIFIMWTEQEVLVNPVLSFLYLRAFSSFSLEPITLASTAPINRFAPSFIGRASMVQWKSDLYAAWDENGLVLCAVYQGIVSSYPWKLIPNVGANKNIVMPASSAILLIHNLILVVVWIEKAVPTGSSGLVGQVRVAQRNDDNDAPLWIFQDGNDKYVGLNKNSQMDARDPAAIVYRGTMYVSWSELNVNGAYEIVIAQRYVQSRDLSLWTYLTPLASTYPEYPFLSSFQPQFAVRRRGFEDIGLLVSWFRDTVTSNVTEVVTGQVLDLDWSATTAGSVLNAYIPPGNDNQTYPNAREARFGSCGDRVYSSWIEMADSRTGPAAASIKLAVLNATADIVSGWTIVGNLSGQNHNFQYDTMDSSLVCSSVTSGSPKLGIIWTEYDGYSLKLRFRHEAAPQILMGSERTSFGEVLTGLPKLKLETGSTPSGFAFSVDKSGLTSYVLTFAYIVEFGHSSATLDAFDHNAFVLNGAVLRDELGQTPDYTLFPRSHDPRSLSFNNDLVIDSSAPIVVSVSSTTRSGSYGVGELFRIEVMFSAPVTVIAGDDGEQPRLYLKSDQLHVLDREQHPALYFDGSDTNVLIFEYTATEIDYCLCLEYYDAQSLELYGPGWFIRRKSTFPTTDAILTLPTPYSANSLSGNRQITIDPKQPRVGSVSSSAADGTYYPGDTLVIAITFSLPVVAFGAPILLLSTGNQQGDSLATLSGGNGTAALEFSYQIRSGDETTLLDVVDDRGLGSGVDYVMSLRLEGGSQIKRLSTNPSTNAVTILPAPGLPGSLSSSNSIAIDSARPYVVDVRSTAIDGTYDIGQSIDILVEFSRQVIVTGTPRLVLNVVAYSKRTAVYIEGSETTVLLFRYTPLPGDNTWSTPLDYADTSSFIYRPLFTEGGALVQPATILGHSDSPSMRADTTLPDPGPVIRADAVHSLVANNHRIYVRTDGFRIQSVQANVPSGVYSPGEKLVLTIIFPSLVVVQGSPIMKLNIDAITTRSASYVSGSGSARIQFEYIVVTGDSCNLLEAASTTAIELNGGAITDINGINVPLKLPVPLSPGSLSFESKISISSLPPSVVRVYSISPAGEYGVGDDLQVVVQFSRRVYVVISATQPAPNLLLQLGAAARPAVYSSGSNTNTIVFSITVATGDSSSDLDYASQYALLGAFLAASSTPVLGVSTVLSTPGSSGSLSATSNVRVTSSPPTIVAVSTTSRNGTYGAYNGIVVRIHFSFPVVVATQPASACFLKLSTSASEPRLASYAGGSTSKVLYFMYTVQPGDQSPRLDYDGQNALLCTLKQFTRRPEVIAVNTLPLPGSIGSIGFSHRIRIDSSAPRVALVTSSMPNGVYGAGQVIDIQIVFSETVVVVNCTPRLRLAIGSDRTPSQRSASYLGGSGSTTLSFTYSVQEGDMALPLEYGDIDALYVDNSLGYIAASTPDQSLYRFASYRLPTPQSSGSLSNSKDIHIDTAEPPRVISVSSPMQDGVYTAGDVVTISLTFTQPVAVSGIPTLLLETGNSISTETHRMAMYASGSGSTTLLFQYVIQVGDQVERLDYRPCPVGDRSHTSVRKWNKLVTCVPASNALRLDIGATIRRQATAPTTDAILDLPETSTWSKVRVETVQQDFIYVDQVEQSSGQIATHADLPALNTFAQVEKHTSRYLYSNGIPDHESSLRLSGQLQEQQYFIELQRFPVQQSLPLRLRPTAGSFFGIFLNGIPFKKSSDSDGVVAVDECGGAIDSSGRYFYNSTPTCFLANLGNPQASPVKGLFDDSASQPPSQLIGYAFDGFPIYGHFDEEGLLPHLDECHGRIRNDGQYCYHLTESESFMPCLKGIDAANAQLLSAFRFPSDIADVEGLSLQELTQFDGFVVDENPKTVSTEATWLNPTGVSVIYTTSKVIVRSNGVPNGAYGPFPNVYNPFTLQPQDYVFTFPRYPSIASSPSAIPRDVPIGVMLNGVPFFSSQSNVYGNVIQNTSSAYVLLDRCNGLIDEGGNYRYYASPDCLIQELGGEIPGSPSPLIGFALDGFPIYGHFNADGITPTDLDQCNGRVGDDGAYRYHTTLKAPFLIGCFRGTPSPGFVSSSENLIRSLSYGHAISINTDLPQVTNVYSNKHSGSYVAGETIDVVVHWSTPVSVDTTGGIPSIQIENSSSAATYDSSKSTPSTSVFIFGIAIDNGEFSHVSRSSIRLNGARIRRLATSPQLDADLNLGNAEYTAQFSSKYQLIKDVQISLRGLYHPQARDLQVRLFHELQSAWIFGPCCGPNDAFGISDPRLRINSAQLHPYSTNPTSGVGWDYHFQDFSAQNLAINGRASATQSSTSGRCVASNAIDGNIRGKITSQNIARTRSKANEAAWWELRLIQPSAIGTIRIWMAQPEKMTAVVIRLRVDSSDGVSTVRGSFTLKYTDPGGIQTETTWISYNAVAMVADENQGIDTVGVGLGESVQAKLAAVRSMPRLFVTRTPADAAQSSYGSFTWDITFLDDPQVYSSELISIGSNNICDGSGVVEFVRLYPGDDKDFLVYKDPSTRGDIAETSMFPFWVMLFEETAVMDIESIDAAFQSAIWTHRVDADFLNRSVLVVHPPPGTVAQHIRLVAESPYAYLTLAEVEVFAEQSHELSFYQSGSPVTPLFYPGAGFWSPEEPLSATFGSMVSEGTWTLSVMDTKEIESTPTSSIHGAGAISDWVLLIKNFGDETMQYYMDIKARVETLPRHGKLYVALDETERDHVDFDGDGVLDSLEADAFLQRYSLNYGVLPEGTRSRTLVSFLSGYDAYGGIEILVDPSRRQKLMPSLCDRECYESHGVDPFMYPGTSGDVGLRLLVVKSDRIVKFVPKPGFLGTDAFTFSIWIGVERSQVLGTVYVSVQKCEDLECIAAAGSMNRNDP